jgi:hypothetical protein
MKARADVGEIVFTATAPGLAEGTLTLDAAKT